MRGTLVREQRPAKPPRPHAGQGGSIALGNRAVGQIVSAGVGPAALSVLRTGVPVGNAALQRLVGRPEGEAEVVSAGVNVRAGAGASTTKLGELRQGDTVPVTGRRGGWVHITFETRPAWVSRRFVKVSHPSARPPTQGSARDSSNVGAPVDIPAPGDLEGLMARPTLTAEQIAKARELIGEVGDEKQRGDLFEALQSKVAYLSQRDNEAKDTAGAAAEGAGGNMCNLTSLAMVLSYLGVPNPHPGLQFEDALEKVRVEKGYGPRTKSDGWGPVAGEFGVTYEFLGAGITSGQEWWVANVLPHLRHGKAIMLSLGGHICRLQGMNADGLVADDPYGRSKLLEGGEKQYRYEKKNAFGKEGETAGNDTVWPWPAVAKHTMKWIAAFSK